MAFKLRVCIPMMDVMFLLCWKHTSLPASTWPTHSLTSCTCLPGLTAFFVEHLLMNPSGTSSAQPHLCCRGPAAPLFLFLAGRPSSSASSSSASPSLLSSSSASYSSVAPSSVKACPVVGRVHVHTPRQSQSRPHWGQPSRPSCPHLVASSACDCPRCRRHLLLQGLTAPSSRNCLRLLQSRGQTVFSRQAPCKLTHTGSILYSHGMSFCRIKA